MKIKILLLLMTMTAGSVSFGSESISIPAGRFSPIYGIEKDQKDFSISKFKIDKYPVNESDFALFLSKNSEWSKEKIGRVFADQKYLQNGAAKNKSKSPITYVSWFVADAYCRSHGGRLPTTLEWEYVAAASEKKANASTDPEFLAGLLNWYSLPSEDHVNLVIGSKKPNWFGVHDLHTLVWEWTDDFNSVFITSDNRQDGDKGNGLFCGGGSIGAKSKDDYAAFIRYSLRGSLKAEYTIGNLGFRCAYDL